VGGREEDAHRTVSQPGSVNTNHNGAKHHSGKPTVVRRASSVSEEGEKHITREAILRYEIGNSKISSWAKRDGSPRIARKSRTRDSFVTAAAKAASQKTSSF